MQRDDLDRRQVQSYAILNAMLDLLRIDQRTFGTAFLLIGALLAGIIVLTLPGAAWAPVDRAWVERGLALVAMLLVAALVQRELWSRRALRQARAHHDDLEARLRHAEKLESLGLLASSIAHDLNNILMPVTMLAPLLLEPNETGDNRQSVQIIISSARRAKELVREMLLFSRKDPLVREPVRVDKLIADSRAMLRAGIPASIAIVEQLAVVPEIRGSAGQLYQVVLNLATNAADAIGARGGTITIGTACSTDAETQAETVHIYVADDGEGMDQATLDRAFEPFFSTKPRLEGTGIGLSTVYGIVKSHGGSITARSALGEGARFDLRFPVPHGAPAP